MSNVFKISPPNDPYHWGFTAVVWRIMRRTWPCCDTFREGTEKISRTFFLNSGPHLPHGSRTFRNFSAPYWWCCLLKHLTYIFACFEFSWISPVIEQARAETCCLWEIVLVSFEKRIWKHHHWQNCKYKERQLEKYRWQLASIYSL